MKSAAKLLTWYKAHGRDLPWRKTRNPYHILVSEVMLQQTQVDRVKSFYKAWLKQFPDWKHLASATNEEVVRAWAGLGYNRRALMLRDAAREVTARSVPTTIEGWRAIKGIGPYTSSAISAFAQKKRVMPIDTNIRRVLGRLLLGKPFPQPEDDELIQKRVDTFLPVRGNYFDVPQAIFDLATDICQKSPKCAECPLRQECPASKKFLSGRVVIPKQMVKKAIESRHNEKPHPDRIYRGRILKCVREATHGVDPRTIGHNIDKKFDPITDSEWVEAMIGRLIKDELLEIRSKKLFLKK
ncbi:MAG: A/G-specific adenine glycosylase [Candidatus Uhrbacteria bacterium]|nr:A/G-specific adenine glycosylase [Candidatus Uhrbacteria bacterium]